MPLLGATAGQFREALSVVRVDEKTIAVAAATIDFTNIPQNFRHLEIMLSSLNDTGTTNILAQFSTDGTTWDSAANYDWQRTISTAATVSSGESLGDTSIFVGAHSNAAATMSSALITLLDYANATLQKTLRSVAGRKAGTATGNLFEYTISGYWRQTAAIKGVRLSNAANNFGVGTRATLYGWA